jgi:hypothetical protein
MLARFWPAMVVRTLGYTIFNGTCQTQRMIISRTVIGGLAVSLFGLMPINMRIGGQSDRL